MAEGCVCSVNFFLQVGLCKHLRSLVLYEMYAKTRSTVKSNPSKRTESPPLYIDSLSSDGKLIVEAIQNDIKLLKDHFSEMLREKDDSIKLLSEELLLVRKEMSKIKGDIDDSIAYELRDTLVFSGESLPEFTTGENTSNMVTALVKEKLKLNIASSDISVSHRLGKKLVGQQRDKRSIIAKFCRRDIKNDVLIQCRRSKPTGFYTNERLTPVRNTILYILRKMKRETNSRLISCSTIDGKVCASVKPDISIRSFNKNDHEKLEEICLSIMDENLSAYLETLPH